MSVNKRKKVVVSMGKKLEAMKRIDRGETLKKIALEYGVSEVTVGDWRRKRQEMEEWWSQKGAGSGLRDRKTMKKSEFENVGEALFSWFTQHREKGTAPITGAMLQEKALIFYKQFNKDSENPDKDEFSASVGWLDRWKKRYGIRQPNICGEKLPVDTTAVLDFDSKFNDFVISGHLSRYQTYKRGETGLSFKMLPAKTLATKEEKSSAGLILNTPRYTGSTSSLPPEKQRKLVTRKHPKTPPGPKNAPEELLELTFIKEEPSTSDNEVAHYEPTFVDVSAPSTIEDGPFIKSEPPETITAESPDETFSKYSEPTCTQSPPEVQSCMTSKTNSASKTSLRPSESALEPPPLVLLSKSSPQASISGKSTEQRNLKKKRSLQDANDRNETLPIFQTDVPEAEVRVRVAELQVEQMKKEYEAKMKNQQIIAEQFKKEHEAKMKEHEAKMKEHELKMKKVKGQIVEMEFRCQEMMKQSVIENKVHELTVMDLEQKLSTNQIIHELTIQELKQKLYNSQLEQQILEKRLNAHPS